MKELLWWQKAVIYQIYPRSFRDSNNDGVGDIRGIIEKVDYLNWLGVDAIWLSPVYPSPMADFGYDISDYKAIDPVFGGITDLYELADALHKKKMKIILDLVPNHTSNMHAWFIESRSSKTNPKRDWYIWKDADGFGGPPNNWLSVFGGSAWEWDEKTGQYYYHAFLKEQPDLNWRNPEVQEAMFDVMRFWFNKGIDGFRIDVLWHLIKDNKFRDNPVNPQFKPGMLTSESLLPIYSTDQDEVLDIVRKLRKVADEFDDRFLIGEVYLPIDRLVKYYGAEGKGVHFPFNFHLIMSEWKPEIIFRLINHYEGSIQKNNWPNWVLGNHDNSRVATRIGRKQAKIAAILLLTLRGTPTIYYGEEIGMVDVYIPEEKMVDPQGIKMPGTKHSRDPERTPMQWSKTKHAGFSENTPWLPVAEDYKIYNVETEKLDNYSFLMLYMRLIALRRSEPSLIYGDYAPVFYDKTLIAYKRVFQNDIIYVILNFTEEEQVFSPDVPINGKILLHTNPRLINHSAGEKILLGPNEAVIIKSEK